METKLNAALRYLAARNAEQAGLMREQRDNLLATLVALTATARTFRNVPKAKQDWGPLDDEALDGAFAAIEQARAKGAA